MDKEIEMSPTNPKYGKIPGEFYDEKYKVLWNIWTTEAILKEVANFEFRPDDVILATFPKSGTTLVQEILWLLFNDIDTEKAKKTPIHVRVPFLELHVFEEDKFESRNHIEVLKDTKTGPRLIKTHLPLRYLAPALERSQAKVINVMRNPKDTMTSYFHFYRGVDDYGPWKGEWNEYFDMWMDGHIVSGDWFDVISEWFKASQNPQFPHLLLFYEDFLQKPAEQIKKIAEFCKKPLDAEGLDTILVHTKFEKMRDNPSTNYTQMPGVNFSFMRKGKIGDWRNHFSDDQDRKFDEQYKLRMVGSEDLHFQYE